MKVPKTIPWRLRLTRKLINQLRALAHQDGRKETDYTRLVLEDHARLMQGQPAYTSLRDKLTISKSS